VPTLQEPYDRIRQSSKDEVILDEMIRLGFWPRDRQDPGGDPAEEVRRRGGLERLLQALLTERGRPTTRWVPIAGRACHI
jgi:hypothetical protein